MPVSHQQIAGLGEFLDSQSEAREVYLRGSAGRYYYSALHIARDVASAYGLPIFTPGVGTHRVIIDGLNNFRGEEQQLLRKIADSLKIMKGLREIADYDIDANFDRTKLINIVERLKRVKAWSEIAISKVQ